MNSMYPTFEQIKLLHKKYAPNDKLFELVFTHCRIVKEIADQIIEKKHLAVNRELVTAAALLHDIGTYTFLNEAKEDKRKYVTHGVVGYEILKKEGFPEDLCKIVERHVGVGITKENITDRDLDLPLKDYLPETIEEKLVLYADKFHSKHPRFNSFESYKNHAKQFGDANVERFEALAEIFGIPDLEELSKRYNHIVV